MNAERPYDVVLFGATGFVGKLTAEYLAEHAPDDVKIALAGRSREKLERVRSGLDPRGAEWPLIEADSGDPESLAAMAGQTRVVLTTVGPYRKYGMPLVEACIEAGTDYCDLTGEVLFINETKERHDEAAKNGARIVHSCGFDSIPSDLGVLLLHEAAKADNAGELGETKLVVVSMRGGISGGTFDSMKGMVDEAKQSSSARKVLGDPYALSPDRSAEPNGDGEGDMTGIAQDDLSGQWVAPFIMSRFNTRIVRRSNALQDWAYGRGFRYQEVSGMGTGPTAPVKGLALAGGLGALAGGLALPPTRKLLDHVLPDPGEGPSEKTRQSGRFKVQIHTKTSTGAHYVSTVAAKGDPGYQATAMMLGETALCLALGGDSLPRKGGVLTPATAMGDALVERLRAAGMTLTVERR